MKGVKGFLSGTLAITILSIIMVFILVCGLLPHGLMAQNLHNNYENVSIYEADTAGEMLDTVQVLVVTVAPPVEINTNTAMLQCELVGLGLAEKVQVGFDYGEELSYGNTTELQEMESPGSISILVRDLKPDTVYHYRAKDAYGDYQSFQPFRRNGKPTGQRSGPGAGLPD